MSTPWLTKGELGKVGVCSNIAQIHSSGTKLSQVGLGSTIVRNHLSTISFGSISGHYWSQFT